MSYSGKTKGGRYRVGQHYRDKSANMLRMTWIENIAENSIITTLHHYDINSQPPIKCDHPSHRPSCDHRRVSTFLIRVRKHAHARATPSLSMLSVTSVIWCLGECLCWLHDVHWPSIQPRSTQSNPSDSNLESWGPRGTKYWVHIICRFCTHHACDFLAVWGKTEPCWNTYGEPLVILSINCFILISRPCMYASEWPFLGARKREGASRAHSPGTAPETSPQRRVCPAWPLELSRCSPKSICDHSYCCSGPWWMVSIIEDPALVHDIPLQRVQQVLFEFCALLIYFLGAELHYAEYTNTTSLDLMHHSFQRSWRHSDLLSSSYWGEGGLWDNSFDCLVNPRPAGGGRFCPPLEYSR